MFNKEKGFSTAVLFFVVVLIMFGVFTFTFLSGKDGLKIIVNNINYFLPGKGILKQTPEINSFYIDGNNFIVKGKYLSKVEVWYRLPPIDPGQTFDTKIGESNDYKEFLLTQKFSLRINCGPFSALKVYAEGYDEQGRRIDKDFFLDLNKYNNFYSNNCPKNTISDVKDGFFVIDSVTNTNIENVNFVLDNKHFSDVPSMLNYAKTLSIGNYDISVSAPGYKDIKKMSFNIPASLSNVSINLVPISSKNNAPAQTKNKLRIAGYVTNDVHDPLEGVEVSLLNYEIKTMTDSKGFYYIDISPQTADLCTDNTMTYYKSGYEKLTITNFGSGYIKTDFVGTIVHSSPVLKLGTGEQISDQKYHLCP